MSRHAREKNPEIRPSCELPLFEQSFYKFEQQHSALPEIEKVPKEVQGEPSVALNPCNGTRSRRIAAQSHGEQTKSCLTAPLSANGESGDCRSLSGTGSPRDVARARKSDPGTSHAAARSVVNIGATREAIMKILRLYGPCTDEKIELIYRGFEARGEFPMRKGSGIRSRRKDLCDWGFVEACGMGKTISNRDCQIWRLK